MVHARMEHDSLLVNCIYGQLDAFRSENLSLSATDLAFAGVRSHFDTFALQGSTIGTE